MHHHPDVLFIESLSLVFFSAAKLTHQMKRPWIEEMVDVGEEKNAVRNKRIYGFYLSSSFFSLLIYFCITMEPLRSSWSFLFVLTFFSTFFFFTLRCILWMYTIKARGSMISSAETFRRTSCDKMNKKFSLFGGTIEREKDNLGEQLLICLLLQHQQFSHVINNRSVENSLSTKLNVELHFYQS